MAAAVSIPLREEAGDVPLCLEEMVSEGLVEYAPFPEALRGRCQSFTRINIDFLRNTGHYKRFFFR